MRPITKLLRSGYARLKSFIGQDASPTIAQQLHATSQDGDLAQLGHARLFWQKGHLIEANAIYQALLQKYPKDLDLLLQMGTVQGQLNNFADAVNLVGRAIAIDPGNASAHCTLGNCLRALNQYEAALASYDQSLSLQPDNADTLSNRAVALLDLQRPDEALECLNRTLAIHPGHTSALENRGATLLSLKRYAQALISYDKVLAIHPDHFSAHCNRALILTELTQYEAACTSYERARDLNPQDAALLCNHGAVLRKLKRYDHALVCYERARSLQPDSIDVLISLGSTLRDLNRHEDALNSFETAVRINPNHPVAHYHCGIALDDLNQHAQALARCDDALQLTPNFAEAHCLRGNVLRGLKRNAEAVESYARALLVKPDYTDAHINQGIALSELKQFDKALKCCDRALRAAPDNPDILCHRSVILRSLKHRKEALTGYDAALRIAPDNAAAYRGRGVVLFELGQFAEALASYNQAIRIEPEHAEARYNLSLCYLQLENFALGWDEHEWRWKTAKFQAHKLKTCIPLWNGEFLSGTLLVWNEQGVGDEIFYSGMLPALEPLVQSITVCVDDRLVSLFQRSFRNVIVISRTSAALTMRFDAQIPMGSLGRHLRRSMTTIPSGRQSYLKACPSRARQLRASIACGKKLVCGLSWLSKNDEIGLTKSLRLRDLDNLLHIPGIDFVDLQYGDTTQEQAALSETAGLTLKRSLEIDAFTDLDGLAALIEACDVIVTISNTTAHLAASLGRPVLLMLPHSQGLLWYWHFDRADSPWYPTAQLFRQSVAGEWQDVISNVSTELIRRHLTHQLNSPCPN